MIKPLSSICSATRFLLMVAEVALIPRPRELCFRKTNVNSPKEEKAQLTFLDDTSPYYPFCIDERSGEKAPHVKLSPAFEEYLLEEVIKKGNDIKMCCSSLHPFLSRNSTNGNIQRYDKLFGQAILDSPSCKGNIEVEMEFGYVPILYAWSRCIVQEARVFVIFKRLEPLKAGESRFSYCLGGAPYKWRSES